MKEPIEILKEKIKKTFKNCVFEMKIKESSVEGCLHVIFKVDDHITFEAQTDVDWSLKNPKQLLYAYVIYYNYYNDRDYKKALCSNFISAFTEDKKVLKVFSMMKNEKKREFYEIIGALKELSNTIEYIYSQGRDLFHKQFLDC